jgi:hypothetical protein
MSRARTAPTAGGAAATLTQVSASAREILETFAATIQPEVAAAVAAAARATRLPPGLFMMMDVGGVTVDCCAFKLIHAENGDSRMPIYEASVETLGVECEVLCRTDPPAHEHLCYSVLTQMRTVICHTYQEYMRANPCWRDGLPVLLVGGGAHHALYRDLVGRIGPWLRHYLAAEGCPGIRLFERPSFDGLLHEGETDDVHRLCVAIGLSSPDYEIPEVMHKREIVPLSRPKPPDLSGRYIGPEMT